MYRIDREYEVHRQDEGELDETVGAISATTREDAARQAKEWVTPLGWVRWEVLTRDTKEVVAWTSVEDGWAVIVKDD